MLPRRLLPWLFALTLLFGQAAAFAHALGHLADEGLASDSACEVCVAQAQVGGGVAPHVRTLPPAPVAMPLLPAARVATVSTPPAYAHARAPPAPPGNPA